MQEGFGPKYLFDLFGIPISETVFVTWIIMAFIMIFVMLTVRNFEQVPGKMQNFIEMVVDGINSLVKQTMGEHNIAFAPYMGTLLIFIGLANIAGLFILRPPTADINTTLSLAMMTFFAIHFFGVKNKGVRYFKEFMEPFPLLLPLNIIGELATPISLGFRLFGNVLGGMIIMSLLYGALSSLQGALSILQFVPVPAVLHVYFDLFAGLLQSFIFTMLTMVFVSMATD